MVANKCDLEEDRVVSTQKGKDLAASINKGVPFFEASALKNINIEPSFHEIIREIQKVKKQSEELNVTQDTPTCCVIL